MEPIRPVVYIIDDDAPIRRAMKRFINAVGLSVETFASARSFLEFESISKHACIITDVKMPELGGIELITELRHRGCRLPVIIVTAFDTEEMRRSAYQAGVVSYFRKPVDAQALLDAVLWASYEGNA
jgi:two-component system response regulator FixJ